MALNIKAALGICGLFITGLCYLVDQVALPVQGVTPPALVQQRELVASALSGERGLPAAPTPLAPVGVAPKFARRSPFEVESDARRAAADPLVVAAVPRPISPTRPVALPPVARPELAEIIDVAETETDPVGSRFAAATVAPPTNRQLRPLMAIRGGGAAQVEGPAADDAATDRTVADTQYTVCKGDSLTKIARREWDSSRPEMLRLLLDANPKLRDRPNRLLVGEVLVIPARPVAQAMPQRGESEAQHAATPDSGQTDEGNMVLASAPATPRWYTIRQGDSLADIARRHLSDVRRWREIVALNGLRDPHKIRPGTRIRLPGLDRSQG